MRCEGRAVHPAPKLATVGSLWHVARRSVVSWSEGLGLRTHIISHSRPVCGVRNAFTQCAIPCPWLTGTDLNDHRLRMLLLQVGGRTAAISVQYVFRRLHAANP